MRIIDGEVPNFVDHSGLRQSAGIEGLLSGQTSVADLFQYLSEFDPSPWEDLVKVIPVWVDREFSLLNKSGEGKSGRGDVLLTGATGEFGAIEVKLNHNVSDEQRRKYESWAAPFRQSYFLASLDPGNPLLSTGWIPTGPMISSRVGERPWSLARDLAEDIARTFRRRRLEIESLFLPLGTSSAKSFAEIRNVEVMRIVTRSLRQPFIDLGVKSACSC